MGVLLWHEGHRVNPERVYRLYQAAGLGERVTRVLTAVAEQRGWPAAVRGDHGPAFTSRGFLAWCAAHHITVQHIQRGQPMQDAWIECFNGRLREGYGTSMPNGFRPLFDTRHTIAAWR